MPNGFCECRVAFGPNGDLGRLILDGAKSRRELAPQAFGFAHDPVRLLAQTAGIHDETLDFIEDLFRFL